MKAKVEQPMIFLILSSVEESILPALGLIKHIKQRFTDYFRCDEQRAFFDQVTDADSLDQVQASRLSNRELLISNRSYDQGEEMALEQKNQHYSAQASLIC